MRKALLLSLILFAVFLFRPPKSALAGPCLHSINNQGQVYDCCNNQDANSQIYSPSLGYCSKSCGGGVCYYDQGSGNWQPTSCNTQACAPVASPTPTITPTPIQVAPSITLTPTITPTPFPTTAYNPIISIPPNLPSSCYMKQFGDADCNGIINNTDFDIWKLSIGNSNVSITYADFFPDRRISLVDFEIWRRYANGTPIPPTPICPQPSPPNCPFEQIVPGGLDGRGCPTVVCISPTPTIFCPYPIPRYCENGIFYPTERDQNGCLLPPVCITPTPGPSATPPPTPIEPTPTGPNCCSGDQLSAGYMCVQNCGPPVVQVNLTITPTPVGYSCLSPSAYALRQRFGCPICLAENTMISTPKGQINVTELTVGMTVWSMDKYGQKVAVPILKLSRVNVPNNHKVYDVKLADGRSLQVSPGHPLADGKDVSSLKSGDLYDGSVVVSNNLIPYDGDKTYDLLPDSDTGAYWANGILMGSTLFYR